MKQDLLEKLKKELSIQGVSLDERSFSEIVDFFYQYSNEITDNLELIEELENKIYKLEIERNKYKELLNEKFLDKNHQTIAHQVGRLIIDFFKNPIKNFISPKSILTIYAQFLQRKSSHQELTVWQKKIVKKYKSEYIQSIDFSFSPIDDKEVNEGDLRKDKTLKNKSYLCTDLSHKTACEIKVAVILDEFSYNSFKDEFIPIIITPNNWKDEFETYQPDIFLCESAWSGVDSIKRPWKGKIYSSVNFAKENRTELLEIIKYCNDHGIPTIFWNKEDPTHYPDRIHDFVKTAQLFDFVFTTAEECVNQYKTDYGLKHVYALPFATNPKLFNPIEFDSNRGKEVIFAGSWYSNHKQRSEMMVQLFDRLKKDGYEVAFYNRYYGSDDPAHKIPYDYRCLERKGVSNKETASLYKSSRYGLNINTVTDSRTMFARRVFELMSSNTLVLSNYSLGVENMFGKNVIFLDKDPDRLSQLTESQIDDIREENLTEVLKNHTYKKRFEQILNAIGITYNKEVVKTTIIVVVESEEQLQKERDIFNKQFGSDKKLLFVISDKVSDLDVAQIYTNFNRSNVNIIAESYIKNYTKSDFNCIETPYFVLVRTLEYLDTTMIEKALLHSSYLDNEFISLTPHDNSRYIFEDRFVMDNIFSTKNNFLKAINSFELEIKSRIFYIVRRDK